MTSFCGSSRANHGKGALNTPVGERFFMLGGASSYQELRAPFNFRWVELSQKRLQALSSDVQVATKVLGGCALASRAVARRLPLANKCPPLLPLYTPVAEASRQPAVQRVRVRS
eukprot:447052-Prorocentrum_minimum.AAC.2